MLKEFYDLQSGHPNPCKYPTLLSKSEIPESTRALYTPLLDHTIAECTADKAVIPLLGDYVGVPLPGVDVKKMEELLAEYIPIKEEFFEDVQDCGCKKAANTALDFQKASGGQIDSKTADKKQEVSAEAKECNVDQYIIDRVSCEILVATADIKWDDVAGLTKLKKNITEIIIWPMLRPDIFQGLRGPPKGLLLFGPPGTGKTMIGKCIAAQCQATFFSISASSLTSKWIGEGEKMVRALFYLAKKNSPSVIFIDEIDSLLSQRSENENEGSRRIKTEFLIQFDGARSADSERILVVGATNRPQEIDEAARRRLVKRIYVPLPDEDARKIIVQNLIRSFENDITEEDLLLISEATAGYSGSDMFNLCREASMEPLREIEDISKANKDKMRPINRKDFFTAMNQIKKSVSQKDLQGYDEWNEKFGSC